eukprot:COSAG05_NODE_2277_length_3294_cov_2.266354_6_plen_84_part_00
MKRRVTGFLHLAFACRCGASRSRKKERAEILAAGQAMFADASPEFASIGAIAAKFEDWKATEPGSYRDTYGLLLPESNRDLIV